MKSGNLNFLEPCEPLQVCNGTDLPLPRGDKSLFGRSGKIKLEYRIKISRKHTNCGVITE